MPSKPTTLARAAALAAAFVQVPLAVAASDEPELEVVTVTATKRSTLLTDLPQSVQAISGDRLATEGVVSMSDIVQVVPGASQTFKASPGFEVLQLRGISSGAVGDSLVGYYIDEIPFGLPNVQYIPPVNVFDLARVEVLRGPQGTLYGQSTMGGAIRLITNRPQLTEFSGEVRAGFGNIKGGADGYKVDAMLNAPITEGKSGVRITAGTSEEDGFIANTGSIRNHNLRVKGFAQLNDALSVEETFWVIRSKQVDYAYGQPLNPYVGITDPNEPRGVDTDVNLANVTVNYAAGIGDLVSATSYMDHEFDYVFALPGLRDLLPGSGQWLSDNRVKTSVFSQEIRLASRDDSRMGWIGGVFFQDSKLRSTQQQGWVAYAPFNLGPLVYTEGDAKLETQSIGVFGELSGKFMDGKLVPTLGLRYYRDERDGLDLRDGVLANSKRTFESVNPRFNLAFKPVEGSLYYMNVAKGFRSGAQQSQAAVAVANAAGLPAATIMPQDELWSYELGAKWSVGSRLAIEAAVYFIDWKDAQITNLLVQNNITTTIISGGNDVRGQGLDIGLSWATPIDGLTLQFAGNVNTTEFKRVPPNTIAVVDEQIPGSPKESATIGANFRRKLGTFDFTSNVSLNYRGEQSELTTGGESDSIHDLRLRLGIGRENWDASVYATNLTDQRGINAILSALVVNPIQPRKIGVDVNVRF